MKRASFTGAVQLWMTISTWRSSAGLEVNTKWSLAIAACRGSIVLPPVIWLKVWMANGAVPFSASGTLTLSTLKFRSRVATQIANAVGRKEYRKLLDKYSKNYKYLELKGADHFSNTLFYEHQHDLYTAMIDFLENDCGQMSLRAQAKAAN